MYRYLSKVTVIFQDHVFDVVSVQLDVDGIVVTMDGDAVDVIREGNNGAVANADVIVKFTTPLMEGARSSLVFEGKVVTSSWAGSEQRHVIIDFVELSAPQQRQLALLVEVIIDPHLRAK